MLILHFTKNKVFKELHHLQAYLKIFYLEITIHCSAIFYLYYFMDLKLVWYHSHEICFKQAMSISVGTIQNIFNL
jgi:hypothetical protein